MTSTATTARAGPGNAAALFRPVRARVQCLVDRPLDRPGLDAERVTALFVRPVRNEVDLGSLRSKLQTTLTDAVAPETRGIWLPRHGRQALMRPIPSCPCEGSSATTSRAATSTAHAHRANAQRGA